MIDQVDKPHRELNLALAKTYGNSGDLKNWGTHEANEIIATEIPQLLLQSNLLPKPGQGRKTHIVSPSANKGVNESSLRDAFGDEYIIHAGDLSEAIPIKKMGVNRFRADGEYLPFAKESIGCIIDFLGISWYKSVQDMFEKMRVGMNPLSSPIPAEYLGGFIVKELFEKWRERLIPGGIVVVDDSQTISNSTINAFGTTGQFIDMVTKTGKIPGFLDPVHIPGVNIGLRIYKKA